MHVKLRLNFAIDLRLNCYYSIWQRRHYRFWVYSLEKRFGFSCFATCRISYFLPFIRKVWHFNCAIYVTI